MSVEFKSLLGGIRTQELTCACLRGHIGIEGNMARIIYDTEQMERNYSPGYPGYNDSRSNGSYALLAIVILFALFYWADPGWLRGNLDPWLNGRSNSRVMTAEGPIARSNAQIRRVTADSLNLREQPGNDARASYILPRGTNVELLGESHQELDGNVWLKVRVETLEGTYVGWVRQQYIE
jgi:hypothetical protein